MIPGLIEYAPVDCAHSDADLHILAVTRDPAARYSLAALLLDAGYRVTVAATFGVPDILLDDGEMFDLMVTVQSAEEMTLVGLPQLARSIAPDMPILLLELDTADSPVVVDLVNDALLRWPLRERETRALH